MLFRKGRMEDGAYGDAIAHSAVTSRPGARRSLLSRLLH